MKNIIIQGVSIGCLVSLLLACNPPKKEEPAKAVIDKEQIKSEIQAKEDAFAQIYNSGTLKNIGYYAEDATSYFQNTAPLVGKEAIVAFLVSDLSSNTDKISFKTNEI